MEFIRGEQEKVMETIIKKIEQIKPEIKVLGLFIILPEQKLSHFSCSSYI